MYCLRNPSARRKFLQLATRRPSSVTASRARWTSDRAGSNSNDNKPEAAVEDEEPLIYPAPATTQHSDLASFQSYARRTGLDEHSTVYVGTRYEYAVAGHLARYGFVLRRVGGARDRGTDLVGTWTLPSAAAASSSSPSSVAPPLRVLVQCKAGAGKQRVGPQHVRELEGALVGAPPGWRGAGVLALLACERPATRGVREALGHSRWPMAFVCCEGGGGGEGVVRQMLWNKRAEECGLHGVDVGTRHGADGQEELVLLRKGKMLPFVSG